MNFEKLESKVDGLYITNKKVFKPLRPLKDSTVKMVFDFAYEMTFGEEGEHRKKRSGGIQERTKGQIFANTFQGKLSEFAVYNLFYKFSIQPPDLSKYKLGKWDTIDLIVNNRNISVKSTKSIGNLLLLESNDYDEEGRYLPNIEKGESEHDYFMLVRIEPFCEQLLKNKKLLYANTANRDTLLNTLNSHKWHYDVPGYISRDELIYIISNNYQIGQNEKLNGKTTMDASNYYVQTGDMHDISNLYKLLSI